jgi:ketosteroid isomerase-like protein
MSEENFETIRSGYEAMNSARASGEELLPLMGGIDPEVIVEMGVLEGTFREGFVRFFEGQAAVFDNLRCEPGEIIDAGETIVVPIRLTGKARSTGLPLDYRAIHVWTLRNGKAIRLRLYESRGKALEAAGLSE